MPLWLSSAPSYATHRPLDPGLYPTHLRHPRFLKAGRQQARCALLPVDCAHCAHSHALRGSLSGSYFELPTALCLAHLRVAALQGHMCFTTHAPQFLPFRLWLVAHTHLSQALRQACWSLRPSYAHLKRGFAPGNSSHDSCSSKRHDML